MIFLQCDNTFHFSVVLIIYLLILNHYLSWLCFKIGLGDISYAIHMQRFYSPLRMWAKNIVSKTIHTPLSPRNLLVNLFIRIIGKNDRQISEPKKYKSNFDY
jgi:hypothetical protein